MKDKTKGITPDKAKRRPNTWNPSPVKNSGTAMGFSGKGMTRKQTYRHQGR